MDKRLNRRTADDFSSLEWIRSHYNSFGPAIDIGPEYLEDTVGSRFFAPDGRCVAHYLVKRGPGSRYLSLVPPTLRPSWVRDEDICEVTAFWIAPDIGRLGRFWIYLIMQVDLFRYGQRRWVLVGTERPSLRTRNRYVYHREVWAGREPGTGSTWYVDALQRRRIPLRVLLVGIPRMALLQLVKQWRKPGFTRSLPEPR